MIYDERFIEIIKKYKELINTSHSYFDPAYTTDSKENWPDCFLNVSLDRFHSDHDLCFANYEKYKSALSEHVEVIKKMQGNSPIRVGRAKRLKEHTWEYDLFIEFQRQQRIELFSKNYTSPACRVTDQYKLAYDNQKIVCCGLYMNVHGNLYLDRCEVIDRETVNTFPVICKAGDPLWESLIEYNKDKIPCNKCKELRGEKAKETDKLKYVIQKPIYDNLHDAIDELPEYYQKESNKFLEELNKPIKAIQSYSNFVERLAERTPINPAKQDPLGLRCWRCYKAIQTADGRNIHCEETEHGLRCQYCQNINTITRVGV